MTREDQKMRSEIVRQSILNTALEIGIEEGFEEVSIRKITNKMKYTTGVVYHHFKDKQEIIDAIEENETRWLGVQISELLDEEKDIIWTMERVFRRIMRLAIEEPEKYNLIVLHKYSRRKPEKPRWLDNISKNLKKDMHLGLIREIDPEKAAFAIWSSFLGFNLMISRNKDLTLEGAEELFKVQFDIILKGVLNNE